MIKRNLTLLFCSSLSLLTACASLSPSQPTPEKAAQSPSPAAETRKKSTVATKPAPVVAKKSKPEAPISEKPLPAPRALDEEILYRLMVAEIAGQRGQLAAAVENYVRAAMLSRDPGVAERATRVAVYARDNANALKVSQLWVELEPDSIEAHQVAAAMLVRRGDVDHALTHLEKVVDIGNSNKEQGYQLITSLLAKERDKKTVMEIMNKLVSKRQDDVHALFAHSQLAHLLDESKSALASVNRILELKPQWTRAIILKSRILVRQANQAESMKILRNALEENPSDIELRMYYARRLVDEKRFTDARDQFERLLEDDEGNSDAIYALGLLAVQTNSLDDAEGYFLRLVKKGQRVNESSYYLGQIEENRKNYSKALQWYGVVRSGEYHFEAQIRTAVVIMRQGHLEQAREHLHNIDAPSAEVELRLILAEAELLRDAGQLQEAFDVYTEALGDMPEETQLLYARALVAEKLDRLDIAEQDLLSILEREPNHAQALNALGYTLADRSDRLDEALEFIQRAYKLRPGDAAIIDSLGWVHYRLGNYQEALKYLSKAFDLINDPEIAAHLGEVLWVTGEQHRAREIWDAAVRDDPNHEVLKDVIRRFTK